MPLVAAFGAEINADPAYGFGARFSDPSDPVSDYIALSEAHASGLPLEFGNLVHSLLGGEERKQARQSEEERRCAHTVQRRGSGKGTVAKSFEDLLFLDLEVSRGEHICRFSRASSGKLSTVYPLRPCHWSRSCSIDFGACSSLSS